jgi:hypothetical protein
MKEYGHKAHEDFIDTNSFDSSNASSDTTINSTNTLTSASVKDGFDVHHVIFYVM